MSLVEQKCVPCEGKSATLPEAEIQKHLKELDGWVRFGKSIGKQFTFRTFTMAMNFVNAVADIAEKEGHHPDMTISYNKVSIELVTHAIGGLSLNDFILASKIDTIGKKE